MKKLITSELISEKTCRAMYNAYVDAEKKDNQGSRKRGNIKIIK